MASHRATNLRNAEAEAAANLFTKQNLSYGQIAKQLGITKDQAKARVKLGLRSLQLASPQLQHQTKSTGRLDDQAESAG